MPTWTLLGDFWGLTQAELPPGAWLAFWRKRRARTGCLPKSQALQATARASYAKQANDDELVRTGERAYSMLSIKSGHRSAPGVPVWTPDSFYDMILHLPGRDDETRGLKAQAVTIAMTVAHQRWLMHEQMLTPIPPTLLIVLAGWLSIIFFGFGLLSRRNATVIGSLFISAFTVSGAFLLILEMYEPYQGLIQVSSGPVREALAQLGR